MALEPPKTDGASSQRKHPEILAPAGDESCFLAALAAGADAIYLGLKQFSARMEAENFGLASLCRLTGLAHNQHRRVFVAMNTLLKPGELVPAYKLARRLSTQVGVDGLIIQDLAMLDLARQAGFNGAIVLSTLANVSNPAGLEEARVMGASRVVLPRELSFAEIRQMADKCPPGLELECFVQGALCYCVSGRCYWSSYMGGRSGLRGRCAQPCRRVYARCAAPGRENAGRHGKKGIIPKNGQRYFACQDLELAAFARQLAQLPEVSSWKIEGRKKGAHYVFHAVTAYRMLRDCADDDTMRKTAQEILMMALGRPGCRARFFPLKKSQPMAPGKQTSSGLMAGKATILQDGSCVLKPYFDLLPGDYLRIGVEDETWHRLLPVHRAVPKGGGFNLQPPKHKTPKNGTPVYLIDRREPGLLKLVAEQRKELDLQGPCSISDVKSRPHTPKGPQTAPYRDILITRALKPGKRESALDKGLRPSHIFGLWLAPRLPAISATLLPKISFWLPPVIWPENEGAFSANIELLLKRGARHFVCNAPWQAGLFPDNVTNLQLLAGPFCNIANGLAVETLAKAGFKGAFASPELSREEYLELPGQSPLPLGIVIGGFWPAGISRFGLAGLNVDECFTSPKGESFWARNHDGTIWLYPGWPLRLEEKRAELMSAGYSFFAYLDEKIPRNFPSCSRPGLFNWDGALL